MGWVKPTVIDAQSVRRESQHSGFVHASWRIGHMRHHHRQLLNRSIQFITSIFFGSIPGFTTVATAIEIKRKRINFAIWPFDCDFQCQTKIFSKSVYFFLRISLVFFIALQRWWRHHLGIQVDRYGQSCFQLRKLFVLLINQYFLLDETTDLH